MEQFSAKGTVALAGAGEKEVCACTRQWRPRSALGACRHPSREKAAGESKIPSVWFGAFQGRDMRCAILVGRISTGFNAHVPDLRGCVAAREIRDETPILIREAIEFHLD